MSRSIHTTYRDLKGLTKKEIDEQFNDPNSDLAALAEKSAIKKKILKERKQKKSAPRMKLLTVDIIEYSDEYEYVTCSFVDVFGKAWYIDEKAPVVLSENISKSVKLPIKGYIAGETISQDGNIFCFCTEKPWGIETRCGENKFFVHENQLIDKC